MFKIKVGKPSLRDLVEIQFDNRFNLYPVPFGEVKDLAEGNVYVVKRSVPWKGVKGEGNHDLVIFFGIRSDLQNQCLSVLKHFAFGHLKTMTLDKYYFPHADFSLNNIRKDKDWKAFLEDLTKSLQTKS